MARGLHTRTACADRRGKDNNREGQRWLHLAGLAFLLFASLGFSAEIRARSPRTLVRGPFWKAGQSPMNPLHLSASVLLVADAQHGFTTLCPAELPMPGGLEI